MKLIDKAAVVTEIERRIQFFTEESGNSNSDIVIALFGLKSFLDTLEVKDMSMPALDNGNMPVERWKEACEAASCQANYRKSKGWTETCDDYFVDGVQWADEHPIKMKEVDLEKECKNYLENNFNSVEEPDEFFTTVMQLDDMVLFAKHFFELGLKARTDKELIEEVYSHIDSIKDTADKMTSGNFMHHKAAIKFSANTIANVLELIGLKAQKGE